MTNREIYEALRNAGMTAAGACAVLGNMAAESGMRPDNAQDLPGVDDADYTAKTDMGLNDFVGDAVGYGLCQWTLASRKAKLLACARESGVSVSDARMQVDFCVTELRADFPDLWALLCRSEDIGLCTARVLDEYERPRERNFDTRLRYAEQAKAAFGGKGIGAKRAAVTAVQLALMLLGRRDGADGVCSGDFLKAARALLDEWEADADE